MSYYIVGLGNPGTEYEGTRHNTGRMIVHYAAEKSGAELLLDKKSAAQVGIGKIGKDKSTFIVPDTFMNKSGKAVAYFVKSPKAAEKLIVIYDDFNLPLGKIRISYNRSSGGHNGLESVIRAVKTEAFVRIRVGVSPATAKGVAKVPHGEAAIEKFILGSFKPAEQKVMKKTAATVLEALTCIITESREKAMSIYNAS